jgi:hypothetical protein
MKSDNPRKKRPNVTVEEYLTFCQEDISKIEYFSFEEKRAKKLYKNITSSDWIALIKGQSIQCYYCGTDLRIIQQLILNKIIKPRKRGPDNYSGLHFELDHKNANKEDNSKENLVASCYYCNNDKSNTFSSDIFKDYFGPQKKKAFEQLLEAKKVAKTQNYRHNLKGKTK